MGLPMQRTCNTHATHMQHTCNTHATHMQHTCNTSIFPVNFQANVAAGAKIYTFHSKTGVGAANVKSCTLTVNLQVKSSCCMSCCMCVACVLHVCCMCVACAGVQDRAVTLSKWRACHADTTASAPHDIAESGQKGVKTVAACISLSRTHISTYAPARALRTHPHTNTRPN